MNDWNRALEPSLPSSAISQQRRLRVLSTNSWRYLIGQWSCQGQRIEIALKMVTEASRNFICSEKLEETIHAQEYSRRLKAKNESKQDRLIMMYKNQS